MNTLRLSDYKDKLIHFIGIGGSSMSGLAELLTALGYQVRGDDRSQSHSTDKLIREGIPVVIGHDECGREKIGRDQRDSGNPDCSGDIGCIGAAVCLRGAVV